MQNLVSGLGKLALRSSGIASQSFVSLTSLNGRLPSSCRAMSSEINYEDIRADKKMYNHHFHAERVKTRVPRRNPLGENTPFAKGVVLRTLVKKPKKPNSANRKCVLVRLSNGKEMTAYVPGEGHNLQEHNVVLVCVGNLRDVPGVKLKCIRGAYDLGHPVKK
ncbi:hypothetical protein TCAL_05591 [Tigriopus californicus]|uniref:Small ribosomal subunit protein uS12m n=1 Tax=Tigriopus californicus TaxID=6832 RepID=A0A553NEB0_TIGCA|nr:small ribosomal subunit protein uS12m-like [Tigriopus californicus]TRY63777.1 hypothetical protein TCAL_05591 [Tigriopus californicus]